MRTGRIAACVLTVALIAACTSTTSGDPSTTPVPTHVSSGSGAASTTSPPSTPQASPTVPATGPNVRPGEKPPTLSKIGRTNTNAGEIIFATYWMRSLDWAYATTSSVLARSLYSQSCVSCARFLTFDIDRVGRHGQHYRGGRIGVVGTRIQPMSGKHFEATAVVDVTVRQTAFALIGPTGTVSDRTAAAAATFRTWLKRDAGSWTIVDWKTVRRR